MGIWHRLLEIIYPERPHCLYCNSPLFFPEVTGLCSQCLSRIEFLISYSFNSVEDALIILNRPEVLPFIMG